MEEKDVMGFDHDFEVIISKLKEGLGHRVVSIIGMGGLCKTTLYINVYNNNNNMVKMHFNFMATVYASNLCKKLRSFCLDFLSS